MLAGHKPGSQRGGTTVCDRAVGCGRAFVLA